jgi:hypothetical protein
MGSDESVIGRAATEGSDAEAAGVDGSTGTGVTVCSEEAGEAGESTVSILVRRSTNIVPVVRQVSYNAR